MTGHNKLIFVNGHNKFCRVGRNPVILAPVFQRQARNSLLLEHVCSQPSGYKQVLFFSCKKTSYCLLVISIYKHQELHFRDQFRTVFGIWILHVWNVLIIKVLKVLFELHSWFRMNFFSSDYYNNVNNYYHYPNHHHNNTDNNHHDTDNYYHNINNYYNDTANDNYRCRIKIEKQTPIYLFRNCTLLVI